MRKSSFVRTMICAVIFTVLFSIPVFFNPNEMNLFEAFWNLFNPFVTVSDRIEIDAIDQARHIFPFFGLTLSTVSLLTVDYEKTQLYIFTRLGSKTKWLLQKYRLIIIHVSVYTTLFIGICAICAALRSVRATESFVLNDFIGVFIQSYISYFLFGLFLSLLCATLALFFKEIYTLVFVWVVFLVIPSQLYSILLNQKIYWAISFLPLSCTYHFLQPMESSFYQNYSFDFNMFQIEGYHWSIPCRLVILLIGVALVLGYFILHRQKFRIKIGRNHYVSN